MPKTQCVHVTLEPGDGLTIGATRISYRGGGLLDLRDAGGEIGLVLRFLGNLLHASVYTDADHAVSRQQASDRRPQGAPSGASAAPEGCGLKSGASAPLVRLGQFPYHRDWNG